MEKSNDYDKIHNEVVHSEQVGEVLLCRSRNRFSWPRKTSWHRVHPCLQENVWLTLLIRFRVWCVTSSNIFAFGLKYNVLKVEM